MSKMEYRGDAITITPDASAGGPEAWMAGMNEPGMWATEDDYQNWNGEPPSDTVSVSSYDGRQPPSRAGSEQPPAKKSRSSQGGDSQGNGSSSRSKAIGKMFFKTKLCCKFRAGTCPYITNCNFAHGIEELRKPPPNWQEIVAAHEDGAEPREEHQIPTLSSSSLSGEVERPYKGRRCKKFYTDEGCPYGDSCTFLHDEQSKARESVAITVGSGGYGGGGSSGGGGSGVGGGGGAGAGGSGSNQKPSNWKTRICNKWETTGYCPFGSKCHFAHGVAELHRYGGGLVESEGRDSSSVAPDSNKAGVSSKAPTDTVVVSSTSAPHIDVYHMGVPPQRSTGISQRQGQRPLQKWKGPDKISRIYGDWIDDNE
uniref:Zinc finger CCCH domain-containing protein 56 n=1 Tax=Anthurium amnicola TaxID=1678845 RepID=A0A1D1ZLM1_9ARAE